MMFRLGHPGFRRIGRFADGSLDDVERARVAVHLEECARCRRHLAFMRAVGEAARSISPPSPPTDSLAAILQRRSAGERIILPGRPPRLPDGARASTGRLVLAGIALLLIGGLLLRPGEAGAGASELRLGATAPRAGDAVPVTYRPASRLAGERELHLRARFRSPEEPASGPAVESRTVAVLNRGRDGKFEGRFVLPASAAFGTLAVEDLGGERVDGNGGRLWEILAHDAAGRPTVGALFQRSQQAIGRDPELGLQTARLMTELYPERPESWQMLWLFEQGGLSAASADSTREMHRRRYAQLERALAAHDRLDAGQLATLHFYGVALGEPTAEEWGTRLLAEHPLHPAAVQLAAFRIAGHAAADPAAIRARLEELWREAGPVSAVAAQIGLALAARGGEAREARRWAGRWTRLDPASAGDVAGHLARHPATRRDAIRLLEERAARLRSAEDAIRPLPLSTAEHRADMVVQAHALEVRLGRLLLEEGRTAEGIGILERVAAEGWEPAAFRTLGEARLGAGDAAGALEMLARAAADPATPAEEAAAIRRLLGAAGDAEWETAVADAREEMRTRLLREAIRRPIDGPALVVDEAGREHDLAALVRGRVAVVAFWHPASPVPEPEALASLERDLRERGVLVLTVATTAPSAAMLDALRERGLAGLSAYYDPAGVAGRAFRQWGMPWFSVLDEAGRIRFETTRPGDVTRRVEAVRGEPGLMARAG